MPQLGKAVTIKNTFNRSTEVTEDINADASTIYSLLTNAKEIPNWNSTVISLEGNYKVGETIKLVSYLDPNRTFKIKVKELIANKKIVLGDMMGTRIFTLKPNGKGGTTFNMYEKIGGLMFPLFANKIPSFDESFERYAADLKQKAETT